MRSPEKKKKKGGKVGKRIQLESGGWCDWLDHRTSAGGLGRYGDVREGSSDRRDDTEWPPMLLGTCAAEAVEPGTMASGDMARAGPVLSPRL